MHLKNPPVYPENLTKYFFQKIFDGVRDCSSLILASKIFYILNKNHF
jgi:hypothetical protein